MKPNNDVMGATGLSGLRGTSRLASVISGALAAAGVWMAATSPALAEINPPDCKANNYSIGVLVDKQKAHVGDTLFYSVQIRNPTEEQAMACRAINIELRTVTPDGRTNQVTLRRTTLNPGESDFYPNVASYVVREQDLRIRNGERIVVGTGISTAVINQNVVDENSDNFRDVNTIIVNPCVQIVATCQGGVGEGAPITYSGSVTNCGDIMLTGVIVTNSVTGAILGPIDLQPREGRSFSGQYSPNLLCGPNAATLTVAGADTFAGGVFTPRTVSASTTVSCGLTFTPGLVMNVNCGPTVAPGQQLTFSGTLQNTGNITLTNVVVTDNVPAANTVVFRQARLAPNETVNFSGSYTAPVACSSTAIFNANGVTVCNVPVSATSRTLTCPIVTVPNVAITRACSTVVPQPGAPLNYSGSVVNRGLAGLRNIRVFSAQGGANPVFTLGELAAGATANFNSSFVAPSGVCSVTDTLTVVAEDICGNSSATNNVSGSCPIGTAPAIVVTHDCPTAVTVAGGLGTATGSVRNSGNVALNNVTVVNGTTTVFGPATLAPNQTATFTFSFMAAADSCSVTTSVTARGNDSCSEALVTNSSTRTCPVATVPSIAISANCPAETPAAGANLIVTGSVQNNGNVTLTNVTVSNGLNRVFGPVTLAPGASANYTATTAVAGNLCSITQTFNAAANDQCLGRQVTATTTQTCPVGSTPGISITANCPAGSLTPGATANYSGVVRNTGTVTLTNVIVLGSGNTPVLSVASLAPAATASFSAPVTVPADVCSVSATFTVSAADNCGGRGVTQTASVTCPVVTIPAIAVTHDCPTTVLTPGATAAFTGVVRNTGNVTLNNVVVNQGNQAVFGPATLAPGATANFNASVTAAADSCSVTTTVTAAGVGNCNNQAVNATSTKTCPVVVAPGIAIVKNCPTTAPAPGSQLTYTATVSNTGNVTLNEITVTSGANRVFGPISLAPGTSREFTASVTVPANSCTITETWVATGRDKCNNTAVNAQNTTTCPVITTGNVEITAACPTGTLTPGATANYTGTVRNTGNVSLKDLVVSRDGAAVANIATLAPGASATYSASVTVPADTCSVAATFSVNASDTCGGAALTKSASVTCPVTTAPAIAVSHSCPDSTLTPGATATFGGTVRNTGNVTLKDVVVNQGSTRVFGPQTLAPGATANFNGSVSVPADSCSVVTAVTATAAGNCNNQAVTATSTQTCAVVVAPGIAIIKNCPTVTPRPGSQLTYTATVSNTGNVTLNEVVVNRGTVRVFGPITLAPGASRDFTASVSVPANSCAITETWVATGRDKCKNTAVNAENTTTCPVQTDAGIAVSLNCPSGSQTPGGTARYTGTVRNTGNVNLKDIAVVNPAAPEVVVATIASLAPGATATFTGNVSVPANVCSVSATFTATATDTCGGRSVSQSASATCPVTTAPAIVVAHECPNGGFLPGQSGSFSASVRNTGNITLSNVVVNLPGNVRAFGPAILQPGETQNFTASITVPANQTACTFSTTLNAAANDACTGRAVTSTSTRSCPVNFNPGLDVALNCPTTAINQGARVVYTGTVRNTGNVALKNIQVFSALTGGTVVYSGSALAPNQTVNFSITTTAPTNCCTTTQTVRATALDNCGNLSVSDTSTAVCPVNYTGSLVLTKDCPAGKMIFVGDTLRYSGTVRNSGNITLTDVRVTTVVGDGSVTLLGPIVLAPGEVVPYKAAYVVPVDYCDSGVAASGTTFCGNRTISAVNPNRCPIMTMPMVMVTQQCPVSAITAGGTYAFTGSVINAGDITLTNVVVRSARTGTAVLVGPISLAPGASANFSGSYTLPLNCCDIVNTVSVTGVDRCNGTAVNNSSSIVCVLENNPALAVTKNCNGAGFTGTVRNSGDITLSGVTVTLGEATKLLGPINLAPGEAFSFSGTDNGDTTVTARGTATCRLETAVVAQANCNGNLNPSVTISSISVVGDNVVLQWNTTPGRKYRLQSCNPEGDAVWNTVEEVNAVESTASAIDTMGNGPCHLYRVVLME